MTTREASELLRDYAGGGSEEAFRRLVEGHTGLVEGTARRQLNGDAALVKDVTQTVFAALAVNPKGVRTSVAAWLHRVTVRRAADAVRGEVRRRQREQAALVCPDCEAVMPEHDDFWAEATPAIDAALDGLPAEDRAILIERFWQRESLRGIGEARGLTENAVGKRIGRSLERLRGELERRGIRGSGSLVSVTLGAALVHAGRGTAKAVGGTAAGTAGTAAKGGTLFNQLVLMTAKQKILTGAVVLVLTGLPVYQQTRINDLNEKLASQTEPASAKEKRAATPVVAAISGEAQSGRKTAPKGKPEPGAKEAAGGGDVVAKITVPGPGVATFSKRGDAVVLDSFRAAGEGAEGGELAALPAADRLGLGMNSSRPAGHTRWDHAQATGAPDTTAPGDQPTAWAPRSLKSGEQWLQLGYDKAVEVKEINVHETYNSGAISKVTAFMPDGSEKTLWTGNAAPGTANEIQETSIPVPKGITSGQVKVYLDTNRVESWPEIDAVELVGRDGTRQWATKSSASSSYSETYSGTGGLETMTRNLERGVENEGGLGGGSDITVLKVDEGKLGEKSTGGTGAVLDLGTKSGRRAATETKP